MFLKMITKKALLIVSIVAIAAVYSCKDDKSSNSEEETNHSVEQTTPANENVALNPAHGEPGHRCEIPVGAPLDTEPSSPSIQSSQGSPVLNTESNTNTSNTQASGNVNPAHGEPGHKCEIPVGAPLDN